MAEFYPQIKWLHICSVIASGTLFLLRGLLMLAGSKRGMVAPVRYLSYALDSLLLASAVALAIVIHQYPLVNDWLSMKLGLLLLYIVLGSLALKRAPTQGARTLCLLLALLTYLCIVATAVQHHPAGVLIWLGWWS